MNRSEARRLLNRHFRSRPGKGDHLLYFDATGRLVFGLATASRSNQRDLPRSVSRKVKELCK